MGSLKDKRCVPCEGGVDPLTKERAILMLQQVPRWDLSEDATTLTCDFNFKDFLAAMAFVDQVADIAQMEDHHPDIHIFYNRVRLELTTHAIKGLSENDFILAAKINTLPA
jgi:4a-hydroxytetrahydrobiopterin dehydratase